MFLSPRARRSCWRMSPRGRYGDRVLMDVYTTVVARPYIPLRKRRRDNPNAIMGLSRRAPPRKLTPHPLVPKRHPATRLETETRQSRETRAVLPRRDASGYNGCLRSNRQGMATTCLWRGRCPLRRLLPRAPVDRYGDTLAQTVSSGTVDGECSIYFVCG